MATLVLIIIVMLLVLIAWMWHSLGRIDSTTKIAWVIGGVFATFILTFIIYNISKIGLKYESIETMKRLRMVYVCLFTLINGYILLPYTFKRLDKINNDEMEKDKFKKSIVILLIIIVALFIFESVYLGNIQEGIIDRIK